MTLNKAPKTFQISTPADLLEKLRYEADVLWSSRSPSDARQRAYLALNCAITAWQMKDWVYSTLRAAGRLGALDALAGRHIKSREDFGAYLVDVVPEFAMAQQIATAAKHLEIREALDDPRIAAVVQPIDRPRRTGYDAELYVFDSDGCMSVPDLMVWLYSRWCHILSRLGLLGTTPLPHDAAEAKTAGSANKTAHD